MKSQDFKEAYPDKPDVIVCSECGLEVNRCSICGEYIYYHELFWCYDGDDFVNNSGKHICDNCLCKMNQDEKEDDYNDDKRMED